MCVCECERARSRQCVRAHINQCMCARVLTEGETSVSVTAMWSANRDAGVVEED